MKPFSLSSRISLEILLPLASAGLAMAANIPLWRVLSGSAGMSVLLSAAMAGFFANYVMLALSCSVRTVKPVLVAIFFLSSVAAYYVGHYGIVLDPGMVRNVMHTDFREARELLSPSLWLAMLPALLASAFIVRLRIESIPLRKSLLWRGGIVAVAFLMLLAGLYASGREFSALMRNQPSLRYMLTPGNLAWSLARVVGKDAISSAHAREPAEPVQRIREGRGKPLLLVMVVGETARAANFSLNGYSRPTNLRLAELPVIYFPDTRACGTSTEVSLPCMFSPFGRTHYDEDRIRQHESLLHMAARAGVDVQWLDNQSGCKGVCDGLPYANLSRGDDPRMCDGDHCYDGILVEGLKHALKGKAGDAMVVLHQIGNHGPAYHARYPAEFARFTPECRHDDLGKCSQQEIINSYDNAIGYTDYLVSELIKYLETLQADHDVALLYVSDHGESLGERGLFLHGMPYALAPHEQKEVPMLWWLPKQTQNDLGVDENCLRGLTKNTASHDNIFHSILGLFGLSTPSYAPGMDFFKACRLRP